MVSGCAFWISPSGPPMMPSPNGHCTVADSSFVPVFSVGTTLSSMAWKIDGTPAMTWTLPMRKPGAIETGLSICVGAARHARHALARVGELHVAAGVVRLEHGIGLGVVFARHAEGLGDRIGGDVVMRRADAAGGEDVGVARRAAR